MNLKSPAFEKALRGKVRAEIRRSPALKRERKRVQRRRRNAPRAIGQVLVAAVVFGILFGSYTRSQALAAGLLAFLGTALLFHHAGKLRVSLFTDPALLIFDNLPLSSEQVFRHQWRQFSGETIWTGFYFTVAYVGFGLFFGFGPAQWAGALLIAGLQWLLIYSVSTLMLARWPGCRFEAISGLLGGLVFPVLSITHKSAGLEMQVPQELYVHCNVIVVDAWDANPDSRHKSSDSSAGHVRRDLA